jgi:hypothetical protein
MKIIKLILLLTINHGVEKKSERDNNRDGFSSHIQSLKRKSQFCSSSEDIKKAIEKQIQDKKTMKNNKINHKLKALNDKFDEYLLNKDINKIMKILDDYCLCSMTNYSAAMDMSEKDSDFKADDYDENCFLTNEALQKKITSNLFFEICCVFGKILEDSHYIVLELSEKQDSSKQKNTIKCYLCDQNPKIYLINDVPTTKEFCLINNCINLVDDFKGKNEVFVSYLKEFYKNYLTKNNKILNHFYGKSPSEEFFTQFNILLNNVIGVNGFTSFESFKGFNLISRDEKRVLWDRNGFHLMNNEDIDILLESNVFFNFLDISRKLLKNLLNNPLQIFPDGIKFDNQIKVNNDENINIINNRGD